MLFQQKFGDGGAGFQFAGLFQLLLLSIQNDVITAAEALPPPQSSRAGTKRAGSSLNTAATVHWRFMALSPFGGQVSSRPFDNPFDNLTA